MTITRMLLTITWVVFFIAFGPHDALVPSVIWALPRTGPSKKSGRRVRTESQSQPAWIVGSVALFAQRGVSPFVLLRSWKTL